MSHCPHKDGQSDYRRDSAHRVLRGSERLAGYVLSSTRTVRESSNPTLQNIAIGINEPVSADDLAEIADRSLHASQAGKSGILTPSAVIGVWDWDVPNDHNHLDSTCAELFSADPKVAKAGISNGGYLGAIYPTDLQNTVTGIQKVLSAGGEFHSEYRFIANNRTRWVMAKGFLHAGHLRPTRKDGGCNSRTTKLVRRA